MYLGIEKQHGFVYEGLGAPEVPVVPTPSVTHAKLIEVETDWEQLASALWSSATSWVFREDSFDAVTRTRRGRLYEPTPGRGQPESHRVGVHPYDDPRLRDTAWGNTPPKELFSYSACATLLNRPRRGVGAVLALGSQRAVSAWRIVQTEAVINGCVMVTLKSLSAFNILPDLNMSKVEPEFKGDVSRAVDRALDAAFREMPISVVDQCRNALTVVLSRWLVQQGHDRAILAADLGKVATAAGGAPYSVGCLSMLAQVVARLHVRGKDNEAHAKNLRAPVDEDAELALHALGFVLRDIGWAA
jgi:hypothetical protein